MAPAQRVVPVVACLKFLSGLRHTTSPPGYRVVPKVLCLEFLCGLRHTTSPVAGENGVSKKVPEWRNGGRRGLPDSQNAGMAEWQTPGT
jgi:hypothetical protein